ncbi:frequency clock protein [Trichoderma gamsii]|uniref:Frequency clock protein n=1 Tax=Trichoderma gamsii TaxID=398673 RepID=A0A2P4Z7H9_9HYPO|nr:frequency clock protein [Trichoderma gamsii]PON20243.1 frequency clock protein [Trichoderma gamsii]
MPPRKRVAGRSRQIRAAKIHHHQAELSSEESNETGQSDAEEWFNQANQNPTATFDSSAMNGEYLSSSLIGHISKYSNTVDSPFFQKESDSSNEDKTFHFQSSPPRSQSKARSSSADDYRSVIDDLTMEIQKLKEDLKRYKQRGPDVLRKDKLFEIKIHGLPKMEKRELEATLREFITTLGDSPDTSSLQRNKKSSRHASRARMYSGTGSKSQSKHASLPSGSHTQPIDSAYASMSTGACSSGTSLNRPQGGSQFKSNEQKVENYLRNIPEGLYPRLISMTNKQKKKLVVRRLERIFTGKIGSRYGRRSQLCQPPAVSTAPSAQATAVDPSPERPMVQEPKPNVNANPSANLNPAPETMREARTLLQEHQSRHTGKNNNSQDMGSASNSNEDQIEPEGNGNGSGSGNGSRRNPSLRMPPPPEQRPTRPRDLDPDRAQIPSENMEYIRRLVLVPPESTATPLERPNDDVHPDEVGWVYLNLLCNIAQLHIMNVTPDFVRNAVVDLSAKFQLSPDGRKIRWRGGRDGTKSSSDSSGDLSQWSPETDDTENTKGDHHKRKKTGRSDYNPSKPGPQVSASSENFHYKPLFHHQKSPNEQSSKKESTLSFFGSTEESNTDSCGQSGSGASNRRKHRRNGTIIYYSGAPFCTDLSGDPGDISPTTYTLSGDRERLVPQMQFVRPMPFRPGSWSSMNRRPLSDTNLDLGSMSKKDVNDGAGMPELVTESGDESSEFSMEFPWSDAQQILEVHPLESCGLGGVLPEDHFMVMVTTRRSKIDAYVNQRSGGQHKLRKETTDNITNGLATMSTSSPRPSVDRLLAMDNLSTIKIDYLSGCTRRLEPVPLPPPAIFFPPLSADSWSEDGFGSDDDEFTPSEEFLELKSKPASVGYLSQRSRLEQR